MPVNHFIYFKYNELTHACARVYDQWLTGKRKARTQWTLLWHHFFLMSVSNRLTIYRYLSLYFPFYCCLMISCRSYDSPEGPNKIKIEILYWGVFPKPDVSFNWYRKYNAIFLSWRVFRLLSSSLLLFPNVSAGISSGLLQEFVELGTSSYALHWIHGVHLFWFRKP